MMGRATLVAAAIVVASCDKKGGKATTATSTSAGHGPTHGIPCGPLDCRQYSTAVEAFLDAVSGSDPLVLGVGEAHAPKGARVPTAARRFAQGVLPAIAGRTSDLLVELMLPPAGCVDATAQVRQEQSRVTSRESAHNQDDYAVMGDEARALGVVPDLLRPSCADMDLVRAAHGDSAIGASLELIARLTRTQTERLVDRDARTDADRGKMVVVYGGLLHNVLAPPADSAEWSYAPAVDAHVHGRFVAIDLVVPEFIGDDDSWRSFAWWPHYDRAKMGARATLFQTGERSFVLVFPAS
jgi:hypothetical protein